MIIDQKYYIPDIVYFIFRKTTPSWKIEEKRIPFLSITYITEGSARYIINGVIHDVRSGDLLCLPYGTVRAGTSNLEDLMSCYSLNFHLLNLQGEMIQIPFPLISHIGLRSDIIGLFQELSGVWLRKENGYLMKSQAIFILILHKFLELTLYKNNSYTMDPRIQKTIKYISEHYSEAITVAMLAELVRLKSVYFGALFKQETGVTLNQYLTKIRINHAVTMLCNREYSISETAERCGYNDVRYFRKQFKSVLGYLPSQCFLQQ